MLYRQKYNINANEEEQEGEKEDGAGKTDEGDDDEVDGEGGSSVGMLNRKYVLAKQYLTELSEKDREELEEIRQKEFEVRQAAHERMMKGEAACSNKELAE
jgi:hypothetical protein